MPKKHSATTSLPLFEHPKDVVRTDKMEDSDAERRNTLVSVVAAIGKIAVERVPEALARLFHALVEQESKLPHATTRLVEFEKLLTDGNPVQALELLLTSKSDIQQRPMPIHGNRGVVRLARHALNRNKLPKPQPEPPAFGFGTAAHGLGEHPNIGTLEKVVIKPSEDGNGRQVVISCTPAQGQAQTNFFDKIQLEDPNVLSFNSSLLLLQEPIVLEGKTAIANWVSEQVTEGLRRLDFKRDDYSDNIKNIRLVLSLHMGTSYEALTQVLMAMHIAFADRNRGVLELIEESSEEGRNLKVDETDLYSVVDWLALAQHWVDTHENETKNANNPEELLKGKVTELNVGNIHIRGNSGKDISIAPGRMDILQIKFGSATDINAQELIDSAIAEALYQGNVNKVRRTDTAGNVYFEKTRLGRSFSAILQVLARNIDPGFIENMNIQVTDLKFQVGDGGADTMLTPDSIPRKEHVAQMHRYLFYLGATIAHQYLHSIQGRDSVEPITLDEIIDVLSKIGFDKINGTLRYLTVDGIREEHVSIVNADEFLTIGSAAVEDAEEREEHRMSHVVATVLKNVALRALGVQSPGEIPEELADICKLDDKNGISLGVKELSSLLLDSSGRVQSSQLLQDLTYLENENMYLIWIAHNNDILRIQIKNGAFCIVSANGYFVEGKLRESIHSSGKNGVHKAMPNFQIRVMRQYEQEQRLRVLKAMVTPTYILERDGSVAEVVEGKPNVLKRNLRTGTARIDFALLEKEATRIAEGKLIDRHGIVELYNLLSKAKNGVWACRCPNSTHKNTGTRAAAVYANEHGTYVYCFGCDQRFGCIRPGEEGRVLATDAITPGIQLPEVDFESYTPVSFGRAKSMEQFSRIAQNLYHLDNSGINYLASRGLHPFNLKNVGYIPPHIGDALTELLSNNRRDLQTYLKIIHKWDKAAGKDHFYMKKEEYWRLDGMESALERMITEEPTSFIQPESLLTAIREAKDAVEKIVRIDQDRDELYSLLQIDLLNEMHRRGAFLPYKKLDQVGGRIIFPCYWLNEVRGELELAPSNFSARAVYDANGEPLCHVHPDEEGKMDPASRKYIKGHYAKVSGDKHPTPVGFTFMEPESFLPDLKIIKTMVVCEGITNAMALSQICPSFQPVIFASNGLGRKQLIAFINRLRKAGYEIDNLVLAYDFDEAGAKKFIQFQKEIQQLTGVNVVPVHEIVPADIREALPLYDEKEMKRLTTKIDLNDLIQQPGLTHYAYNKEELLFDSVFHP
ncbi:hypothetical protein COX64_02170 [Candidatus Dojkabacteria bacterium CG_4_10_14_0_2_um_filter_Dojkabacteria_WS6_41_15]|uniref:Toprim domain-containing protein n=1 Tax=Candidatus Dojkabacteria bacterium CG_4_10_14_0_2_um_filter_Dojkabacteria_WS6_41_15 TaxID=2014249 RepID=A0A2M7W263_9BACT|nr:MAG: hypothetical protein COX64_02170 [Candidatus Dojkabacteria bacterium CG_4_10_14_0_2_um_filter_Dojkabacteria_WS6_41_15]